MDIKVSASILSADPMHLARDIKAVEDAGVDFIHIDVMDGHFVPNLTMGPFITKGVKAITDVPLDIHLMIDNPEAFIGPFAEYASDGDIITFHIEAASNPQTVIAAIKGRGLQAGVALNPGTPFAAIEDVIEDVDLVLAMTVNPGFSGQKFMADVMPKLEKISRAVGGGKYVAVDGGLTGDTTPIAVLHGANLIAAASAVFKPVDTNLAVREIRDSAGKRSGLRPD